MKNKIIYHRADLDGWCSGAIALHYVRSQGDDAQMIGWDYGDPCPIDGDEDFIIMTDISLPVEDMKRLYQMDCEKMWIDHHKSAIQDAQDHGYRFAGSQKVGDSASLLAWKYFFPGLSVPSIVDYIDRYDVWKRDETWGKILAMQYGLRSTMRDPSLDFKGWQDMFFGVGVIMNEIFKIGSSILDYTQNLYERQAKAAFTVEFEGLKFCALNSCNGGSTTVDPAATEEHDALMVFRFDQAKWRVSLYKNEKSPKEIDLSLIAKKWGGGGHAGACGFEVDDINKIIKQHD